VASLDSMPLYAWLPHPFRVRQPYHIYLNLRLLFACV